MFGRYRRLLIALGAAAIVSAGVLVTSALAETPTPGATPAPPGTERAAKPTRSGTNYGDVFLGKLAAALGIDQPKLESSIKQASKDTVDEAAQKGDLTQTQADRLKQRIDEGGRGLFGGLWMGRFHHGGLPLGVRTARWHFSMHGDTVITAVAGKLGLTADALKAELRAGKSLSDLATEKNVSEADLRAAAVAAVKAQLDQAVQDGKLTQKQADSILKRIEQGPLLELRRMGPRAPRNGGSPTPTAPAGEAS